ncbi:uncharacterized protein [Henckelia pumila]|uniref:uncharacterized protein n=1 Tax=Henckelia pumila TaxID=405737 RepID=UPI003C6E1FDE
MVSIGREPRVFGQKVLLMSEEGHDKVELSPGAQFVKLAADLSTSVRQSLVDFLKKNKDVFAWSISELTGVSAEIMVHRLNTLVGVRPIKQKKRHFGPEKDKVIKKEVEELLKAGHIREVQFPTWISNVVLVPKSSGATYQRLMDRVFASQISRNVEVYVDDILVKSQDDVGLVADLEETFSTLRAYRVKLNPEKCVFGVRGGKFLGYMVTEGGLRLTQRKCKPSGPCFLLAICKKFRAKKFEWDEECEKEFNDLKNYLAKLPVLAKAVPRDPLYIYLSALEEAVSSVLIRKEGTTQHPIYFFSHALKGAELRYSEVEKLALALVMTDRKLRPYFLSHPIVVLTNSPIGRILTRADISGRLVKWNKELSEYDIQYEPRMWSGCAFDLPPGDEIRLAVRLDLRASNNESEYEVVLIGLRAAKQAGAARVHMYSDSQLVAQQVNGSYEVKSEKLKQYMRAVEESRSLFDEVMFEQIPRENNEKADSLVKMASSLHNWKTREVVVQVELTPSTELAPLTQEESDWRKELLEYMERGSYQGIQRRHIG